MWIWVALCTTVFVVYVLTTPTFHALVRPPYRNWSLMAGGIAVADEVRRRWPGATISEAQRLAWAYYRLLVLGPLDRRLSFTEFRRQRRVVLMASVVIGRHWQWLADPRHPWSWRSDAAEVAESLWFVLRVLVRPTLLLGRSGRDRLPRLPMRKRIRRAVPHHAGERSATPMQARASLLYSVVTPFACLGENGYQPGWYEHPDWDHEWTLMFAALFKAGVWTDGEPVARATRRPVRGGQAKPDRDEVEAMQERREEALERLSDQLREITGDLIEMAQYRLGRPDHQEREDAPTSHPPSSPASPGSSGTSGYSSPSDDWDDSHDFYNWD
ncbi:hypothetical protein ABN028_10880 [Actinopolymorpha sp. B17G11]|uniref:hypothetical protein n=1 Tax=Actinopolymorpha sp. B17G11 TaxID=3160861 RepID=UPI0032E4AB43